MIALAGVTKTYDGRAALVDVTLDLPRGLHVLIGPSGCGKSTLLRTINRMIEPDAGRITVDGRDVLTEDPTALRRKIGYVIQSAGLFPHWSVAANIGAVPKLLGWPAARIAERVHALASLLSLDPSLLPRLPATLSGGQAQRVGIARALAAEPPVLLMDEPFSALDPITRGALQGEIRTIQHQTGTTIVVVTHDMEEALALGDTVTVMRAGRVVQQGTPTDILRSPADADVAAFLDPARTPLRLLAQSRVRDAMRAEIVQAEPIDAAATLDAALARMLAARTDALAVMHEGRVIGSLHLSDLPRAW